MNDNRYTAFNALVDIIAAPATALDEVKSRVSWLWLPLGISIILGIAVFLYYYTWVDFDWMVDEMIRNLPPEAGSGAAEAIREYTKPGIQIVTTAVAIVVITFLVYAIQSAYLHLVNRVSGGPSLTYGQWFSFSAWTGFVLIFNTLAMLVVILMADSNQLGQDQLTPLSMQALFIHAEPMTPWFNWGNALSLPHFWALGLMAVGYRRWTGTGLGVSIAIALAPWVAVFGIWALIIA